MKAPCTSFPRPLGCSCTGRALGEPDKVEQAQKRRRVCVTPPEPGGLSTCVLSERDGPNWAERRSSRISTFLQSLSLCPP